MFIDTCGGSLESHQSYIITHRADDKIMDSGVCFFGEFDREKIKGMNPTGINRLMFPATQTEPQTTHHPRYHP